VAHHYAQSHKPPNEPLLQINKTETEKAPVVQPKRVSNGTQTPTKPEALTPIASPKRATPPPNASPRRSYAKTVSNGLDTRGSNECIKPTNQTNNKDNKEIEDKKVVQNGTILNGNEEKPHNGKEVRIYNKYNNNRENKRTFTNGQVKENGTDISDNGKTNWQNNERKTNGKDRGHGGKNNNFKKENGHDGNSIKYKDVAQTNGRERPANGKYKNDVVKRQQVIVFDEPEHPSASSSDLADDSDSAFGQFRPVENRRNRTNYNGHIRSKLSPQPKPEPENEMIVEQMEVKETVKELKNSFKECRPVESDISSTISELSSPTELSSGQNTPPHTATAQSDTVQASELNKSVEKLKEGLEERKAKKSLKKARKAGAAKKVDVKETKEEEVFDEPAELPEFLREPRNELMDLDLGDALDHFLLKSLRQSEPAISKVNIWQKRLVSVMGGGDGSHFERYNVYK